MAASLSQLGILLIEKGDTENAVGNNVRSLAVGLDLGSPTLE